jgi:hypothetical protein
MILGPESPCFVEVDAAVAALQAERGDARPVVFFWQYDVEQIPKGAIVFNFDLPLVHFSTDAMRVAASRASEVWEFSELGLDAWRRVGVTAKHVPVGYHPSMTRLARVEPTIDVVFAGSMNARRLSVFHELQERGLTVALATTHRGERDELLARCRCSVNMLFYPKTGVYPVLRAAHLLANDVPYVGERSPGSEWDPTREGFVTYDALADAVVALVRSGRRGDRAAFARHPMRLPT